MNRKRNVKNKIEFTEYTIGEKNLPCSYSTKKGEKSSIKIILITIHYVIFAEI